VFGIDGAPGLRSGSAGAQSPKSRATHTAITANDLKLENPLTRREFVNVKIKNNEMNYNLNNRDNKTKSVLHFTTCVRSPEGEKHDEKDYSNYKHRQQLRVG